MGRIDRAISLALRKAKRYDFKTFAVGISIPADIQEREDELRSQLKLMGGDTIKTQVAGLIAEGVANSTGRKVDKSRPDLMLLMNFERWEVEATSRPAFLYARYTKPPGVWQKRERCGSCKGAGCKRCRHTGFEPGLSVEDLVRNRLAREGGSEKMIFTWMGSEDRDSVVFPPGRPFVVEVKNPRKRRFPRRFLVRFRGGQVAVSAGKMLPARPLKLPSFRFRTRIEGETKAKVDGEGLGMLRRTFKNALVRFDRPKGRPTEKMVYHLAARAKGKKLLIDAELDGGLPVKRFVSGELVSPSVSEVLKTEVRCRKFDICEVRKMGEFEFAEVSRVKKKN